MELADAVYCEVTTPEKVGFVQILMKFWFRENFKEYVAFERRITAPDTNWKIIGRFKA